MNLGLQYGHIWHDLKDANALEELVEYPMSGDDFLEWANTIEREAFVAMFNASQFVWHLNGGDAGFGHMKFTPEGITYVGYGQSVTDFHPEKAPF